MHKPTIFKFIWLAGLAVCLAFWISTIHSYRATEFSVLDELLNGGYQFIYFVARVVYDLFKLGLLILATWICGRRILPARKVEITEVK